MFSILHPCFISSGVSWLRDDHGEEVALRVSDYLADDPFVERWTFSKAPVPSTRRRSWSPASPGRCRRG